MNPKTVALLAGGLVAAAGVGTAIGDLGNDDRDRTPRELEVRKDDGFDDVELIDDEDDGDGSRGDGEKSADANESRADASASRQGGDQSTGQASASKGATGDGDATAGNDGSSGGDNSYIAPAADDGYVAPAPAAPVYYGGSDDGGSDG